MHAAPNKQIITLVEMHREYKEKQMSPSIMHWRIPETLLFHRSSLLAYHRPCDSWHFWGGKCWKKDGQAERHSLKRSKCI
ncbi:hypothetical protein DUNSADRAFT_6642 [Dunaliella salina]|uniref:Uncharacterized protein n=1 Tax=Dunaliella salina TaxID=3046 RepID=A0ABQ7GMU3_DUNSA|nr:hypothetical protein DUNSADRAFT_6642 [Dunaliella salina]|eukprot:KAF5835931.1 hypothetical protein DUNSADRAFT_6642 [Dunaliella salina]